MNPVSPASAETSSAASRAQWVVVSLLVVSVAINYIDRANLSVSASLLRSELRISPAELGLLLSSFFWTYTAFQPLAGWLSDRFDVRWVMGLGFLVWTAMTTATGFAAGFGALVACRLAVGMGESVAYPSYAKILTLQLSERPRGFANAAIDAGSKVGPAVGTFAGGLLVARYGWRPFFIGLGLLGFLWLPCWARGVPKKLPLVREATAPGGPTIREILGHRAIWATFVGHFAGNYFWYFLLTWLPYYLVRARGFSMSTMAGVGAAAPLCSAGATLLAGWWSLRALAAGATATRVRKTCTAAGLGFATVVVLVPVIHGSVASMAILMFASMAYGVFASSHWAITCTLAGPLAVGRWSGMQNCVGNLAGVVAPAVTGLVVGSTGSFFGAFLATAIVSLTGSMAYLFGLGPVEPAVWKGAAEAARPALACGTDSTV